MLETKRALSLRASLLISMLLTILPLVLSIVFGYYLLSHTVIADYQDVSRRQREQIEPLHHLQIAILQADVPLDEYLVTARPESLLFYRSLLQGIETDIVALSQQFKPQSAHATLLQGAHADWKAAELSASDTLAYKKSGDQAQETQALSKFDSRQSLAIEKLSALHDSLEKNLSDDYAGAALGFERSRWLAGIGVGISLLVMAGGIIMFTRNIMLSIEKLVKGAELFAAGHRDHVIEVQVPPELHRVAQEFNKMIKVIQQSEDSLADQARRDKLTGLHNRRAYEEFAADAYARLQRMGEKIALVALDIDHFKKVNDTWGHAAGDQVLIHVARTIQDSVRSIDKVFRFGGEEFTILLPGADTTAAKGTAERIRSTVEESPIQVDGKPLHVTVSLGIAFAGTPADGEPVQLQKRADMALYQAKQAGRNKVIAA
jgi:diguanylate cyclase (GGDEF)-like protein